MSKKMIKKSRGKRPLAQSTLEYAVLIVLIAVALLASQIYIRRAMQGRMKGAADDIGEQFSLQAGNTRINQTSSSVTSETVSSGVTTSNLTGAEVSTRTVNTYFDVKSAQNEYWGCLRAGKTCTGGGDCCSGVCAGGLCVGS